ncbi:MAG: hypothetical protein LBE12_01925 [Planctomycetaceae bacterium]|jgi:hypothetical protein|nr:hypothetical protein [Planctomycetaceae bacterium]
MKKLTIIILLVITLCLPTALLHAQGRRTRSRTKTTVKKESVQKEGVQSESVVKESVVSESVVNESVVKESLSEGNKTTPQNSQPPVTEGTGIVTAKSATVNGEFRAILVTVQNHDPVVAGENRNLPNAWADISAISKQLSKLGYNDITIISDEQKANLQLYSNRNNILHALESLAKRTKKEDTVLMIMITHGVLEKGVSQFILSNNEKISANDIYAAIDKCPTQHKLLIFEACRSSNNSKDFIEGTEKYPQGVTVFHSCSKGEKANFIKNLDEQSPNEEHSIFLHYLIRGLAEADYVVGGNNGNLTVSELYNYLRNKVYEDKSLRESLGENVNERQTPETLSYDSSFVVGIHPIINPFLKMRVPMDTQLETGLEQLVDAGNRAIQSASKRLGMSFLESWYYMRKASRIPTMFRRIAAYTDAAVADYARGLLQSWWIKELTEIGDRCFSLSIELRDDPKAYLYRADMNRSLGLFVNALQDYNNGGEDMNLYILLDKTMYNQPPQGLNRLEVRNFKDSKKELKQTVNQKLDESKPSLEKRFENWLQKNKELYDITSQDLIKENWQSLTLEQKTALVERLEQQSLSFEQRIDRGTVYANSSGLITSEFEQQASLGTIAEYVAKKLAAANNNILPQDENKTENSKGENSKGENNSESKDDLRVCRLVVQEIHGNGNQPAWIKASVCDLGVEFEGWFTVHDVFWSKDLAEHYWVSVGEHSPIYRNAQAALRARVESIHNAVATYEGIAKILSRFVSLPDVGGYFAQIEDIIRKIVIYRLRIRMGEAESAFNRDFNSNWRRLALEAETKDFDKRYNDAQNQTQNQ